MGRLLHEHPISSFKLQENRSTSGELLRFKDHFHFFFKTKDLYDINIVLLSNIIFFNPKCKVLLLPIAKRCI